MPPVALFQLSLGRPVVLQVPFEAPPTCCGEGAVPMHFIFMPLPLVLAPVGPNVRAKPLLLPLIELALIPAPVCPREGALAVLPALSKIALIAALHTRCVSTSRDGPHSARPPRPSLQALRCCTLISHTHLFPLGKAIEPCPCGSPSSKSPV